MNPLFLADIKLNDFNQTAELPVVNGWCWKLSGDGTGYLLAPFDERYCQFNLGAGTIQYTSEDAPQTLSEPTLVKVQELGEQYMDEVLFSEADRADLAEHLEARVEQVKTRKKEIYESLKGTVTLSYDGHGNWKTNVDVDKLKELTGIESQPVLEGKDAGVDLFNRAAESLMVGTALKDPLGYMKTPDNLYDCIYKEYNSQYTNALNAIDDGFIDGTGYSVSSVLDNLPKIVRSDITKQIVQKGEKYSDLRFITPTDEQKKLVKDVVKARLGLTLIYEKKRSYEDSAKNKAADTLTQACEKLSDAIYGDTSIQKTNDTPLSL